MLSRYRDISQSFTNGLTARVLDEKLKKEGLDKPIVVPGSSRKRQRQSQG
jgi:hypothetical protein